MSTAEHAAVADVATGPVLRRVHLGTRQPANWMQLLKFGLVGGSGYAINLAVFALLDRPARRPPHRRRGRRLLRRGDQQLPLEPALDVRRRRRPRRVPGGALLRRQPRRPRPSTWSCWSCSSTARASPTLAAQAIAVALTMPVNFIGNKLWTFDSRPPRSRSPPPC